MSNYDWARKAAERIAKDLRGRKGIDHAFDEIDAKTRKEIVETHYGLIVQAYRDSKSNPQNLPWGDDLGASSR